MKKMIFFVFLIIALFGCGGGGGGSADVEGSDKVAIFGEAKYDAGHVFDE